MDDGWKTRAYILGAVGGLLAGALAAYLYVRSYEEAQLEGRTPTGPQTMDMVRLGLNVLGLVRQIGALGAPGSE